MLDERLNGLVARSKSHILFVPTNARFHGPSAEQKLNAELAKWDKAAGRKLTKTELIRGVNHPDPRDARQRVRDNARITKSEDLEARNPHKIWLDYDEEVRGEKKTFRQKVEDQAREWEAQRDRESEIARLNADPAYQQQTEASGIRYSRAYYDPKTTVRVCEQLEKLHTLSVDNSPDYAELKAEIDKQDSERRAAEVTRLNAVLDQTKQDIQAQLDGMKGDRPPTLLERYQALREADDRAVEEAKLRADKVPSNENLDALMSTLQRSEGLMDLDRHNLTEDTIVAYESQFTGAEPVEN